MIVEQLPNGRWRQNCYLLHDGKELLVIDPGSEADRIILAIDATGATPTAIVNTHAHFDHIGGVAELKHRYGVPLYLHRGDRRLLRSANLYRKLFDGDGPVKVPKVEHWLEGGPLAIGSLRAEIVETPGHTQGSVCVRVGQELFVGDTLLDGAIGRVDLPGGDAVALTRSLAKIADLDASLRVHPGHGPTTTLEAQLATNQPLRGLLESL